MALSACNLSDSAVIRATLETTLERSIFILYDPFDNALSLSLFTLDASNVLR